MKFAFFTVPVFHSDYATSELNRFLADHRIQDIQQKLIDNGSNSFWTFSIKYGERDSSGTESSSSKSRIDYRDVLDDDDFEVFAQLRDLRKQISDETGVPLYGIFSNAQLAEMARRRPASAAELGEIKKVGKSRVERFGERFLTLLSSLTETTGEADADTD
jgi:superfamily II DNA helicase RecQ